MSPHPIAQAIEALRRYLLVYEGVYDMAIPVRHQSEEAKDAEREAIAALAALEACQVVEGRIRSPGLDSDEPYGFQRADQKSGMYPPGPALLVLLSESEE